MSLRSCDRPPRPPECLVLFGGRTCPADRHRRVNASVQRRKGGRKPNDSSYWLRGCVFCLSCGAALYTRTLAKGREYTCSNVRQATGLCDAPSIPADLIEGHVLDHLKAFVGDAQAWLAHQAAERDDGREKLWTPPRAP